MTGKFKIVRDMRLYALTLGVFICAHGFLNLTAHAVELSDPCQDPDRPRLSNLYEGQIDFLLRTYYPEKYLDDERKQILLSRFGDIQQRDSENLSERFKALQPFEQECLNEIFKDGGVLDGRLLTLQDNDVDGVPDFRINYTGEFFENDTDADDDGIDNVVDVFPFDGEKFNVMDVDKDGIADHLDWSNSSLYSVDYGQGELAIRLSDLKKQYESGELPDARYGVFNGYSLENMWEWHAEYVTASVLDRIYKAAEKMLSGEEFDAIHACVEAKLLALYGEGYTYELERADPAILRTLASIYPIADENLDYLATEYVIEPFAACAGG